MRLIRFFQLMSSLFVGYGILLELAQTLKRHVVNLERQSAENSRLRAVNQEVTIANRTFVNAIDELQRNSQAALKMADHYHAQLYPTRKTDIWGNEINPLVGVSTRDIRAGETFTIGNGPAHDVDTDLDPAA